MGDFCLLGGSGAAVWYRPMPDPCMHGPPFIVKLRLIRLIRLRPIRLIRLIRLIRVIRLVRVIRLIRLIRLISLIRLIRLIRPIRPIRPIRIGAPSRYVTVRKGVEWLELRDHSTGYCEQYVTIANM